MVNDKAKAPLAIVIFGLGVMVGIIASGGDPDAAEPAPSTIGSTADSRAFEPAESVPPSTADSVAEQRALPFGMATASFSESFDDNTGMERFRTGVFHRDVDAHDFPLGEPGERTWNGDHDQDCGGVETQRVLDKANRDDAVYTCRDHMMTSMGPVDSYSVVWFAPDEAFSTISEVCWDVNISTEVNGHRQWWEVAVTPVEAPEVTAISWLAGTANLPDYGNAVVLGFGPDNPPHPKISVGNDVVGRGGSDDLEAANSVMIRRPHCFTDDGRGTLTYSTVNADGSPYSFEAPGEFPDGPLKVVFKDHSYTPDKDCAEMPGGVCQSYTWHWDNIVVRL